MPSENPIFQRFPDVIIPKSNHRVRWPGTRVSTGGSDARTTRGSRPYWVSDLTNCLATERIKDEILAMTYRNRGEARPVLMRVAPFCELGVITGKDMHGENLVEPAFLGNANAVKTFQLRKRLLVEGYENEFIYHIVTKPEWDYPTRPGMVETMAGVVEHDEMREIQVYRFDVPIPREKFTVDRNTGAVTVTNDIDGTLTVSGGFYIPMLLPADGIPFEQEGTVYKIGAVQMSEPNGGR